tara:strand:- start:486 stop:1694 length:1209 start_codon:yes stop_codon:yes gene_type:complete
MNSDVKSVNDDNDENDEFSHTSHTSNRKNSIIPKLDPKSWTTNIERILDNLRINCAQLSNYHRYKYAHCKKQIKWFKIPVIILSGINTFISVGIKELLNQTYISIATAVVSLLCGVITSIEMFMKYQDKMETELHTYKAYYKISMDIYSMISIDKNLRSKNGQEFLKEQMEEYSKIKHNSRPEDHFDLIHDLISDIDEVIVYQRKSTKYPDRKEKWINKIEMPPHIDSYEPKTNEIISYDKYRHPHKYALRSQVKRLETKKKITQRSIDKEYSNEYHQENPGWFDWFGRGNNNNNNDDNLEIVILPSEQEVEDKIIDLVKKFNSHYGRNPLVDEILHNISDTIKDTKYDNEEYIESVLKKNSEIFKLNKEVNEKDNLSLSTLLDENENINEIVTTKNIEDEV